jgi:hypothetical protein
VTNDVRIRVTADQRGANLGDAKRQSGELKDQVTRDAASIAAASERVTKAREREENAAGRVRVAELKLKQIRDNAKATDLQRAQAEERLAAAHRASAASVRASTEAAEKLAAARAKADEHTPAAEPDEKIKRKVEFDMSKSFLDKGQLLSEVKSVGVQAGAVLAGAMGAGLTPVAAAGLFVGIAAAAQSSNQQVRAAYSGMWEHIKAEAQADSAGMAGTFISMAESLGQTFNRLRPELVDGFAAAKPVIADVMDGIDRGARAVMPGLVVGAHAAKDATNGLADMMQSAGTAVSNFFTESSAGAAAGGDAMRTFGLILERMGTFAGRILADLSRNSSTVMGPLAGTVNAAAGAIENLAHTALPALASGASFALTGMTLLINLASTLLGALGPLIPTIATVASSLKLIDLISFGQVGKSWGAFKTSVGEGEGILGKVKSGAGALLGTLGPVGLAAGLVTVGLGYLSTEQEAAAVAAANHAKREDLLTDALRKSNGAINENVRLAAAQALGQMAVNKAFESKDGIKKNMIQGAQDLNINTRLLTDAYLGQGDSLGKLNHELDNIMSPYKDYNDMMAHATPEEQKRWMLAELMKDTINKQGGEFAEAAHKAAELAAATGQTADSTNKLAGEFKTLADDASSAEQKVSALQKIMDEMAGRQPDVEATARAWDEFIDAFNKKDAGFDGKAVGTKKWAEALLNANGTIDTTTNNGRKLFDLVKTGEKDFLTTAEAMHTAGNSAGEIEGRLQTMRDEFVKNTQAMGFTKAEAEALANKYGLIPANVSTLVTSNLSPEMQKALQFGGIIRSLPDGSVEITTNTTGAQGRIDKFIQDNSGRVITLHINTVSGVTTVNNSGQFSRLKATGGPVAHAAQGGARTGPILMNEQGPEGARMPNGDLIDFADVGVDVVPASNMAAMRQSAGPAEVRLTLDVTGIDSALGAAFGNWFKRAVRVSGKGGNVQAAFGAA